MLNRKGNKLANGAVQGRPSQASAGTGLKHRRRFIISPKAHGHLASRSEEGRNGIAKAPSALAVKAGAPGGGKASPHLNRGPAPTIDLTETIKTLLHLA